MTALPEPERLASLAIGEAWRAGSRGDIHSYPAKARDLLAALRPLLATEPEIVTGEQARELPKGSRFVPLTPDGTPILGASVIGVGAPTLDGVSYLVLHRAPAPAPKVGDVVETAAELDQLPNGTVVRTHTGLTAERWDTEDWWLMGADGTVPPANLRLPARVLDLGGDS